MSTILQALDKAPEGSLIRIQDTKGDFHTFSIWFEDATNDWEYFQIRNLDVCGVGATFSDVLKEIQNILG